MTDNGSPENAESANLTAEQFPLRLRVHALARMLGSTSRDVLTHLGEMGVTARTAQSSISRDDAFAVAQRLGGPVETPQAEKPKAETPHVEKPASAASAASPSLFSAVETVEPTSASAPDDAAAPLFLAPEADDSKAKGNTSRNKGQKAKPAETEPAENKPAETESAENKSAKTESAENRSAEKSVDKPADPTPADESGGDDNGGNDGNDGGDSRARRRRRGRRGRGRGRGDQNDGDQNSSDQSGSDHNSSDQSGSDQSAEGTDGDAKKDDAKGAGKNGQHKNDQGKNDQGKNGQNQKSGENATESKSDDKSDSESGSDDSGDSSNDSVPTSKRRRRRRRRRGGGDGDDQTSDDPPNTVVHEREPRAKRARDEVQGISGSTRLEAKRQRRRDGRDAGRRRPPILTESEFLARRESVERVMVVRERSANGSMTSHEHDAPTEDYTQVAVVEDGVLVEHFVTTETSQSMVGNIYLGRVQNVLPGMEAAFVDIGRGRNGVLYAGEVNWEAAGLDGRSRKIEQALKPGDSVLVQVSKDPVGHKGARLTTQISLAGRYLVYVPGGSSTGISRKLPDTERKRLKQILSKVVPDGAGVIIRTASEGVSEEELAADVKRLEAQWKGIESSADEHKAKGSGTTRALYEEPDLLVRVVRDLFNEDFTKLVVEGGKAWKLVSGYVKDVAPDLMERVDEFSKAHADAPDSFAVHRIDEQLAKALDRKVWLPSGGTLIIEHTEAMTVVDVNTGKFTGSGGNLEETVTRNNLEAAEEIVRQMRLRDIGGMIVVDFIDMVLESNRDLVLRRLTEALARDRTRHQVSEVTSLGLVQMTRKRLGTGLLEAFSTTCTACSGRGVIVHANPVEVRPSDDGSRDSGGRRSRRKRGRGDAAPAASSGGDQRSEQKTESKDAQKAAPHKPAADHPLFRAMAHHEEDGEGKAVESKPAETKRAETKPVEPKAGETKPVETKAAETKAAEPKAAESKAAESKHAEPEPAEPVVKTTPRRRRAVRRPAAPTAVVPEAVTVEQNTEPVTTVAAPSAEPAVTVTRTPRRRSGRRAAGAPPTSE
ncbi:Rne/Rng family ribonuclease [Gordonia zhaorongruii]|uniref:Rne/Rng family ribonuclease n=1 Tax=Gordonia zhaorongruii TaxID=2597659 RepID=UPI00117D79DD|nr:Rne/Rng family ribonuclease [Gordonia zhaorongruii]